MVYFFLLTLIFSIIAIAVVLRPKKTEHESKNTDVTTQLPAKKVKTFSVDTLSNTSGVVPVIAPLSPDLILSDIFFRQTQVVETENNTHKPKSCALCSRTFHLSAKYCYVDGLKLSKIAKTTEFLACTTCGVEGSECECESGEVVISEHRTSCISTIPLARCPICMGLGPINSLCGNDQTPRIAVFELNFRVFPAKGFGPRRNTCLKCGSQFGRAARYCSFDGKKLSALN